MELKNCSRCGKVFLSHSGLGLCRDCSLINQEEFEKVRAYLRDNPQSDIITISEATGVPKKKVLEYLREGRLTLVPGSLELECERCGDPITTGRFCSKCAAEIQGQSGATYPRSVDEPTRAPSRDLPPLSRQEARPKVIRDKFRRR